MNIVNPSPSPEQVAAMQKAAMDFLKANNPTDPGATVAFPKAVALAMVKYGLDLNGDWGQALLAGFGEEGKSIFAFVNHNRAESAFWNYAAQKAKAGGPLGTTVTPKQAALLHAQIDGLQALLNAKNALIARQDALIADYEKRLGVPSTGGSGGPGVIK